MLIDGKKIAADILSNVNIRAKQLSSPPRLAAILVESPDNSPSVFLKLKKSAAEKAGIDFRLYKFPEDIKTKDLRQKINSIASQSVVDGILVQLLLPEHIDSQVVLNAIPLAKDVDVISQAGQGAFFVNRSKILPPTVNALKIILERHDIILRGKVCAVFGYGRLVGKPVSHWLTSQGATVLIINEYTVNPARFSREADLIISGAGQLNLIKSDMVKDNAVIIDFGYNQIDGQPQGDVDFKDVSPKTVSLCVGIIVPIPT